MPVRIPTIETISQTDGRFAHRVAELGPVSIGEIDFLHDLSVECDDIGSGYFVQLAISGRFTSRYRGVDTAVTRDSGAVYRPGGGSFLGRWAAGYRALCVRLDTASVDGALTRLAGERAPTRTAFDHSMKTTDGFGRDWAALVFSLNRQLAKPDGLLSQPLVAAPLAESVVNGFLLATGHSYSAALGAAVTAARPVSVRMAVDLIEADPRSPLTVSLLAEHCGVNARTLQNGFRKHLGMSPMAYVREVRLRRAHEELREGDPFVDTVSAVARRWGFRHLGRFAAMHEAKYDRTPLHTLRGQ